MLSRGAKPRTWPLTDLSSRTCSLLVHKDILRQQNLSSAKSRDVKIVPCLTPYKGTHCNHTSFALSGTKSHLFTFFKCPSMWRLLTDETDIPQENKGLRPSLNSPGSALAGHRLREPRLVFTTLIWTSAKCFPFFEGFSAKNLGFGHPSSRALHGRIWVTLRNGHEILSQKS